MNIIKTISLTSSKVSLIKIFLMITIAVMIIDLVLIILSYIKKLKIFEFDKISVFLLMGWIGFFIAYSLFFIFTNYSNPIGKLKAIINISFFLLYIFTFAFFYPTLISFFSKLISKKRIVFNFVLVTLILIFAFLGIFY